MARGGLNKRNSSANSRLIILATNDLIFIITSVTKVRSFVISVTKNSFATRTMTLPFIERMMKRLLLSCSVYLFSSACMSTTDLDLGWFRPLVIAMVHLDLTFVMVELI